MLKEPITSLLIRVILKQYYSNIDYHRQSKYVIQLKSDLGYSTRIYHRKRWAYATSQKTYGFSQRAKYILTNTKNI